MATLTYAGTDFTTTLGGLPTISRRITRELHPTTQTVMKERHVITLVWNAVPAEGQAIDTDQSAIAAFEAAVEALPHDGALIYARNSGDVYWAYNSAGSANNHVCPKGIKITVEDFPHQPAAKVTHQPIVLTFECEVFPCSNDPTVGIASLAY
ncbi:MAG TPA: hypothetical protein VFH61_17975, partial [Thermoleophilia bacterium]|nr:hypothetical protein [Thermoleophilia bacterium]